jgi:spore coat protein JB
MHSEQLDLIKTLQALEFSAFDFNLYLDTHPSDQRALAEYSNLMREVRIAENTYNQKYGPLMAEDNVNQSGWRWAIDPWPWDIEY